MVEHSVTVSPPREGGARSVVVVGAGVIGLATAWELLEAGWDVTVCDPEPMSGASFAAAGMLAPVSEVVWDQPTLYGLMVSAAMVWPRLAGRVASAVGRPVGHLTTETLVCASDRADRQALADLAVLQRRLGMDLDEISSSTARALEPALGPGVVGAVRIPDDHQVDPRRLMDALLEVIGRRGTVVTQQVTGVWWRDEAEGERRVGGVRLADGATLAADEVLVAAGLASGELEGLPDGLDLPLRPVWGDILRVRVPERLRPLLTRTVRGLVHGLPVYLVPRDDGTLVIGATSREDGLAGPSVGGVHQLLRDAQRLVPGVLECELLEVTARARPGTPDDVPLIGRVAPGLTVSTGYFRHGILLSALGARLGADLVAGKDIEPETAAAVDPYRFAPASAAPTRSTEEAAR
ncbi:glycine oxidase ThiO [Raineyella fluvialis]|nr:glycine oxidase ThiO [Raineyella fluvialis]